MKKPVKRDKAIDPPMCKVCQTKHWLINPHVWPKKSGRRKKRGS